MAQTPATWDDYVGNGVEDTYQVTFPYQKEQEVFAYVDEVPATFTFISEGWIQFDVVPATGAAIRIQRSTEAFEPRHEFENGVPLLPRFIDENNKQFLYVVQEAVNETAGVAAEALANSEEALALVGEFGFRPLGDYRAGLTFTAYNQYMVRDTFLYRPAPGTLPFTTSGVWASDVGLFVLFSQDDVLRTDLAGVGGGGLVGFAPEQPYPEGTVGGELLKMDAERHRTLSHLPMLGYNFQFGSSDEHFLSKNAVVILGDSITQGANAGNYAEDGWAHKVKRALMEAYRSTSYGYLGMALKPGFEDAPTGAYRWYQITTDGTARENENALNSLGGGEIEITGAQSIVVKFNRMDTYGSQIVPNQRRYRLSFNDSTGSVRVTASGIGYSINEVVPTSGTGVSDLLALPQSWDGTITITAETGTPVINGVVFMSSDTDYGIHLLYNGGLALSEMSDAAITRAIDKADLYIHALGVNDGWGAIPQATYDAKVDHVIATLEASRKTRCIVMDFGWNQPRHRFTRVGLRKIARDIPNEVKLLDIPAILANGGAEFAAAQLATPELRFLSSDAVHPFINGHNMIASLVLAELGISRNVPYMLTGAERRRPVLEASRTLGYTFQPRDLATVITGWSAPSGQSITFTEAGGCIATGVISLAYIETRIPVVDGMQYVITLDVENINSTGTLSLGTRSLDLLGNEIWQQDSAGSLNGNIQPVGPPAIGLRQTYKLVVGGSNTVGGTDVNKFEPGARFFNVAMIINNGDPAGQMRLHGVAVTPVTDSAIVAQVATFSNSWASAAGLYSKRSIEGVVRLSGSVQNAGSPASGSNMMTMPVGHRPAVQLEVPIIDGNGVAARLRFEVGGVVRLYGTSAPGWGNLNLSAVSFTV